MNNFEKTYLESNQFERNAGFHWYNDGHNYLKDMSIHFNVPLKIVCGLVAVISPGLSWSQNTLLAYHILKFKSRLPSFIKNACYPANLKKAVAIYRTKKVFPHLKGPKVVQFYFNLLNPFDDGCITIDRFMISCYYNELNIDSLKKYMSPKHIETLKVEISKLSIKYDLLPCQFQAIVWLAYHRIVKSMVSYSGQLQLKIF